MTLLDKVKALFAEDAPKADTTFVKTKDGLIFLVKSPELKEEADIVLIDEAGAEQAIEDGDYVLEDGTTLTITKGKVAVITPYKEEQDEVATEETLAEEVELEKIPAGEYTLDNGDSIVIDENQVVVNWIKADVAKEEPVIEEMREEPATEEVNMESVNQEMDSLKAELEKVKAELEAKALELNSTKESFEKLKKEPATTPLDTRKFEKAENRKDNTFLSKVQEITNKK
mgnify:CR=1 FL=1